VGLKLVFSLGDQLSDLFLVLNFNNELPGLLSFVVAVILVLLAALDMVLVPRVFQVTVIVQRCFPRQVAHLLLEYLVDLLLVDVLLLLRSVSDSTSVDPITAIHIIDVLLAAAIFPERAHHLPASHIF